MIESSCSQIIRQVKTERITQFESSSSKEPSTDVDEDASTVVISDTDGQERKDEKVTVMKAKLKVTLFDMKRGNDDLLYICPVCNEPFLSQVKAWNHLKCHDLDPSTSCDNDSIISQYDMNNDTSGKSNLSTSGNDSDSDIFAESSVSVPTSEGDGSELTSPKSSTADDDAKYKVSNMGNAVGKVSDAMSKLQRIPLHKRQSNDNVLYNCSECKKPFLSLANAVNHTKCHKMCRPIPPGSPNITETMVTSRSHIDDHDHQTKINDFRQNSNQSEEFSTESITSPGPPIENAENGGLPAISQSSPTKKNSDISTTCEICHKKYCNAAYCNLHKQVKHGVGNCDTTCVKCGMKFWSQDKLDKHMSSCKSGKPVKPQVFLDKPEVFSCMEIQEFQIDVEVGAKIDKTDEMEKNEMHNQTSFKCLQCSHSFGSKSGIVAHMQFVHKKFMCANLSCSKSYGSIQNYKMHMYKIHNIGDYDLKCNNCKKKFWNKQELKKHVTKCKKYVCEWPSCQRSFQSKHSRDIHASWHHRKTINPMANNKHGKSNGAIPNEYSSHSMTRAKVSSKVNHPEGEGKITCAICQKRFLFDYALESHMKFKHGVGYDKTAKVMSLPEKKKKVKAEKKCVAKVQLKTLEKKERKFRCKICNRDFGCLAALYGHQRFKHKKLQRLVCTKCKRHFYDRFYFGKHILEHKEKDSRRKEHCPVLKHIQRKSDKTITTVKPQLDKTKSQREECSPECSPAPRRIQRLSDEMVKDKHHLDNMDKTKKSERKEHSSTSRRIQGESDKPVKENQRLDKKEKNSEDKVTCSLCGYSYRSDNHSLRVGALKVHMREEHQSPQSAKQQTPITRVNRPDIHGAQQDGEEEEFTGIPLNCPYCCGKFKNKENLRFHIHALHEKHGDDHAECHLCKKRFIGKQPLNAHLSIIHGENVEDDPDYIPEKPPPKDSMNNGSNERSVRHSGNPGASSENENFSVSCSETAKLHRESKQTSRKNTKPVDSQSELSTCDPPSKVQSDVTENNQMIPESGTDENARDLEESHGSDKVVVGIESDHNYAIQLENNRQTQGKEFGIQQEKVQSQGRKPVENALVVLTPMRSSTGGRSVMMNDGVPRRRCQLCNKTFISEEWLQRHLKEHLQN